MPNNQNIQDALLKEKVLTLFKERYSQLFLEKLSSVDSILKALGTRYSKKFEDKELAKKNFKQLFNQETTQEEIGNLIAELKLKGNNRAAEANRVVSFFSNPQKEIEDLRDKSLSDRTRFILDAISLEVGFSFWELLNDNPTLDVLHFALGDFKEYSSSYKNQPLPDGEEVYNVIQNDIMVALNSYIEQCIRNPLLGTRVKKEAQGFISVEGASIVPVPLEDSQVVEPENDGFVPMLDDDFISFSSDGTLTINPKMFVIRKTGLSLEEMKTKITELHKEIKEHSPSIPQAIEKKAPKVGGIPHKVPNQSQKPASTSGIRSKTRLALEIGGILSSSGIGAGVGALLGTFVFPGVGTALGAIAGSVVGATAGVTAVGMARGLTKNPLAGSILATAGASGFGAAIGGIMGTFVFPGLGTAVGAAIGAASGFVAVAAPSLVVGVLAGLKGLVNSLVNKSSSATNSSEAEPPASSTNDVVSSYDQMNSLLGKEPAPEPAPEAAPKQTTSSSVPVNIQQEVNIQEEGEETTVSNQLSNSLEVDFSSSYKSNLKKVDDSVGSEGDDDSSEELSKSCPAGYKM